MIPRSILEAAEEFIENGNYRGFNKECYLDGFKACFTHLTQMAEGEFDEDAVKIGEVAIDNGHFKDMYALEITDGLKLACKQAELAACKERWRQLQFKAECIQSNRDELAKELSQAREDAESWRSNHATLLEASNKEIAALKALLERVNRLFDIDKDKLCIMSSDSYLAENIRAALEPK